MKTIPDFPNYMIDTGGNIYSKRGNLKANSVNAGGYKIIQLWSNNKGYTKLVHRLVLETFVGPCPKGMECCRNDSNKANNKLENLRWDTSKNNHKDAIKRGTHSCLLKGEKSSGAKLTDKQVRLIKDIAENTDLFHKTIADIFGISQSQVTRIINYKSR